jgi:hypothetical protein
MPTPRVNPERVLTAAERQARRRELLERRIAVLEVAAVRIADEATTLAEAQTLARDALELTR